MAHPGRITTTVWMGDDILGGWRTLFHKPDLSDLGGPYLEAVRELHLRFGFCPLRFPHQEESPK